MGKGSNVLPFNSQAVLKAKAVDGKQTEWRIAGVRGLVLICQPSGKATWWFYYSQSVGKVRKLRKLRIGGRDAVPLTDARTRAVEMLQAVEAGGDPVSELKSRRESTTFKELAELRLSQDQNLASSTKAQYAQLLNAHVYPTIGDMPASEVSKGVVSALLDKVEARGARRQCDLVKAVIGATYKWAIKRGTGIEIDPTAGLGKRAPLGVRNRVPSENELREFCNALNDPAAPLSKPMRLLLKLTILTGQRRSEVAGARVSELKLDGPRPTWTIPGDTRSRGKIIEGRTKNGKEQVLPLSTQAVALFREALSECADDSLIFPANLDRVKIGATPKTAHINGNSVSRAMRNLRTDTTDKTATKNAREFQKRSSMSDITPHDLRRCISTWLGNSGVRSDVIDLILNHLPASTDVTRRHYNFATLEEPVRQALQAWGNHVSELQGAAPAGSNVVRLAGAGA